MKASNKLWSEQTLESPIPELLREIEIYETEIELRKQGKMDEKLFAETRLRRGAYGQRYDNGQRWDGKETRALSFPSSSTELTKGPNTAWDAPGMQRIKVPFGGMKPEQLEVMAELAEEYSDNIAHVTTRQDFQLHFVHIEDTPALMRRLAAVGITTREVADFSQKIAEAEGNPEFHISNAWLTQVENSDSVPSIFKLYSLSSIYRIKFTDLLLLYGLDLQHLSRNQMDSPLPDTHLTNLEVYDQERTVSFPIRFDRSFDIDNTNLLSRLVEVWGEVPIALIQHLDIRHGLYGYIGLHDMTLYPLLRPGSFVQIDPSVRKVQPMRWRTEFDRPIYFVELRDGYACSWCELQDGHLLLLPHPLSPRGVRRLAHGTEAEIVGQVTAVAMTLAPLAPARDAAARLPKQV